MKLTKRQLKRIIREEYNRLKRRGLIREMGGNIQACIDECLMAIPSNMKRICSMGMGHMVTNDIYHLCVPICQRHGCDPDSIAQQVEDILCGR